MSHSGFDVGIELRQCVVRRPPTGEEHELTAEQGEESKVDKVVSSIGIEQIEQRSEDGLTVMSKLGDQRAENE